MITNIILYSYRIIIAVRPVGVFIALKLAIRERNPVRQKKRIQSCNNCSEMFVQQSSHCRLNTYLQQYC